MKIHDYDLIVVGGGLGGAALVKVISGPELQIDDSVRARFFGEQDQAAQQCA